ncbi:hypothetical protein GCM10011390_17280 [Aureimonas endophytica]|uniref:Uncharacterized protein n=1 Tax=Aureimonas endophytica TaxID=2027858 RepID=A0A916ZIV1_9HYPH|nr:hypothetical protein [Aureimonas endophytica]GGD99010.1 hypothetical protein GCM10011390_17280 [Aureimonas endophytica]
MVRGNIELATTEAIQGWIFTEDGKVRNRTVLAFKGDLCVGAGKVDSFRPDLADAGMGDGYLGFSFPISVAPGEAGAVVVKLEGSDAILLQHGAFVTTGATPVEGLDRATVRRRLAELKWALKHGRIAQADFDYLRILWSLGVYERGLVRRNAGEEAIVTDKPAAAAAALLESYVEMDTEIEAIRVESAEAFSAELAELAVGEVPVAAVHAGHRAVLRVLEGSHVADASGRGAPFVDYPLSAANLVMLDARATVELVLPEGGAVDIFVARPAQS